MEIEREKKIADLDSRIDYYKKDRDKWISKRAKIMEDRRKILLNKYEKKGISNPFSKETDFENRLNKVIDKKINSLEQQKREVSRD